MPDFRPARFFAFRTPLYPFDELLAFSEGLTAPDAVPAAVPAAVAADPAALAAAIAADLRMLRERLKAAVTRPELREAIFVASPDLDTALAGWLQDPEGEKGQRAERALYRYFARSAGRATPFGLFAASSVGHAGTETRLRVPERRARRRHTRLDMDYLAALTDALARDPAARARFVYRPNSSLYRAADRFRLVEQRLDQRERTYHLVAIDDSPHLVQALESAAEGARLDDVAAAVAGDDVTAEEARAFVEELVEAQVLVPDIGLHVTGDEPAGELAARLLAEPATAEAGGRLRDAVEELARLDDGGLGGDPERYRGVARLLEGLPAKPELPKLFQVDLTGSSEATLGNALLDEIVRAVELFQRLVPAPTGGDLAAFRDALAERYEEREVPLVEALDEEMGIGYPPYRSGGSEGAPLLAGLPFPDAPADTVRWREREKLLLERLTRAMARGEREIVLTEEDVPKLGAKEPRPLPDAFALIGKLAGTSEPRLVLDGVGGPSAANLLGRFCHMDPELHRLVEELLRAEEALLPDAIFAEVVHLPQGRTGNILLRPVLRQYEIALLGDSGAPRERQIPLTDLTVSVAGGQVVLRSRRLGKRVVPRLTTAHNYSTRSIGIYRFLGELQGQGVLSGFGFSWGALGDAPVLPRVVFGRVVLATARWKLSAAELKKLSGKGAADRYAAVQRLRGQLKLPRWIVLADADNELPVDLDNALAVDSFVALVERREQVELKEMLPAPDQLAAEGADGRYVHELVIPFLRTGPRPPAVAPGLDLEGGPQPEAAPADPPVVAPAVRRTFPPGSEWLYVKLYCGSAGADGLLIDVLEPAVRAALESGACDRWFFLRFGDPRDHLRLRLHGDPARLRGEVLASLLEAAERSMEEGHAWKLQLDTYEREVERYGGPLGIGPVERLFWADSEAVLEMLGMLEEGDAGSEERWRLALRGMDVLFDDLGLDPAARRRLAGRMRDGLSREVREDADLKRAMGERFRKISRELAALLDGTSDAESPLEPGFQVLRRRSERSAEALDELKALERGGRLTRPLATLAESIAHMHVNRMLRSAQRRQELVLYDFLGRLYARREAMAKPPRDEPSR